MTGADRAASTNRIADRSTYRIELFGAPRVLRAGADVRVPVKKAVAVLAFLAVETRATRAKVATLLWADADDEAARRNLRRELFRLREVGLGDLLRVDDDRIALAESVQTDVGEFLAATMDGVAAVDGLSLYRGPLLDGFDLPESQEFNDWLAAKRDEFARRWSQAAAARATQLETGGDARSSLALHAQLLAHDPLQESHYANAMRLHYLLGERGAALDLYERLRATLKRELDLDPLPETAAFAERVRAAEHLAPLVARAGSAGIARFVAPLVGRERELEVLRAVPARVMLLIGEPGVGKSRLADEFTQSLPRRLVITATQISRGAPLHAVNEALRRALEVPEQRALLARLDPGQWKELARFAPELADAPSTSAYEPPTAALRERFFGAVVAALSALADDGALWIDDLHWADDTTLDLVEHLAFVLGRADDRRAARVVATARAQELADAPRAADLVRKLERARLLQRVELAPLDDATTLALVRSLSGSTRGTLFAQRLQRATHGNPYFLLETIRFLFDSGDLTIDERGTWATRYDEDTGAYAELPVPPTVQQAVIERIERLGPAARRVLETAALAGDGFVLEEVQPATALSEWEALEGLERALHANLLAAATPGYRFAHDLARGALDARLGTERRRLIHRRLADALEVRRARPDRIALHFESAGEAIRALPWRIAAARAAERVFAWREALDHYAAALAHSTEPAQRAPLHRARYALLKQVFTLPEVLAEADALAALAEAAGDAALATEALVWRATGYNMSDNFPPALEAIERAQAKAASADLSTALRYDLHLVIAQTKHGLGRFDEVEAHLAAGFARLDELGSRQKMDLYFRRAYLAMSRNDSQGAYEPSRTTLELARAAGDVEMQGHAASMLAYCQHVQGDTAAALETMLAAQATAERASLVGVQRSLLTNLVKLHVVSNQGDAALARMQQAIRLFASVDDAATHSRLQSRLAEVLQLTGDLGGALAAAAESIRLLESIGGSAGTFWPWYQHARLLWLCGASDVAVATYQGLPSSPAWNDLARPAVKFFTQALRLPDAAREVADAIGALPRSGDHSYHDADDWLYWRAYALLLAGDHDAAQELARDLQVPPFTLHAASVCALRLRIAVACNREIEARIADARALASNAPPLEGVELDAALAAALDSLRKPAEAAAIRTTLAARIEWLAGTLGDAAQRAAFFARHRALI